MLKLNVRYVYVYFMPSLTDTIGLLSVDNVSGGLKKMLINFSTCIISLWRIEWFFSLTVNILEFAFVPS